MIIQYKKDGKTFYRIQLSYVDRYGKRYQPKFSKTPHGERISSRRSAQKLELQYYNEFMAKKEGDFSQLLFSDWRKQFLKNIRYIYKRGTIMQYDGDLSKWLSPSISDQKLSEIKKTDIHKFIFEEISSKGASLNTQKKVCRVLKRIFQAALEEGLIARNPVTGIRVKVPPPQKKILNTQEVEKLLLEAKKIDHPFYFHWALALFTGMRNGELYGLRWTDIDEVSNIITISAQCTNKDGFHATKSNRNRIFPISEAVKEILIELKGIGPFQENLKGLNGTSHEFNNLVLPRSSQWKHGEQAKITKEFCKTIQISEVSFHDLRATFITNLLAQNVSLPKVMSIVGHTQIDTTNEYLRLAGVNVKGSTDMIGYQLPKESKDNLIQLFSRINK